MERPMNDADFSELIDKAMAGKLTPEEEVRWNGLLAERPELEEDLAVGRALQALPPPPRVSSNFTALVLQQIQREKRAGERRDSTKPRGWFRWPGFARISAIAAVTLVLAVAGLQLRQEHELQAAAQTFAGGMSKVSETRNAPEAVVAVFKDFAAIRNLSEQSEAVDYKLLAALSPEK
jgi:hypothetical protein